MLVAIPGWHGSCRSTFGEHDESLFSLLHEKRFYDFDCFDYNSDTCSIDESTKNLRQRLEQLRTRYQYKRALVVTHSTGGVIYLNLLCDLFLNDDDTPRTAAEIDAAFRSLPEIHHALLWASPVNGLTWLVSVGSIPVSAISGNAVLQDLGDKDSAFLQRLRRRLAALERSFRADQGTPGTEYRKLKWEFFQGQTSDRVVKSITSADAFAGGGWLVEGSRDDLIDTGTFHSSNVGTPGTPDAQRYPQHITQSHAIDWLRSHPRLALFDSSTLVGESVPDAIVRRQQRIVEAILDDVRRDVTDTRRWDDPVIPFLSRILETRRPRSRDVDQEFLDGLQSTIDDLLNTNGADPGSVGKTCAGVLNAVSSFSPIPRDVAASDSDSLTQVGHGTLKAIQALEEIAGKTAEASYSRFANDQAPVNVGAFSTRRDIGRTYFELLLAYYESVHDVVRIESLKALVSFVAHAEALTIQQAEMARKIGTFVERRHLLAQEKPLFAGVFEALLARKESAISTAALKELNRPVAQKYLGGYPPLWVVLANDSDVKSLAETAISSSSDPSETFALLVEVSARAGATGNNVVLARWAAERAVAMIGTTSDDDMKSWMNTVYDNRATWASYPVIMRTARGTT